MTNLLFNKLQKPNLLQAISLVPTLGALFLFGSGLLHHGGFIYVEGIEGYTMLAFALLFASGSLLTANSIYNKPQSDLRNEDATESQSVTER